MLLYLIGKIYYLVIYLTIYYITLLYNLKYSSRKRKEYNEKAWDNLIFYICIKFGAFFRKALQFTCTRTEFFPNENSIVRNVCDQVEEMPKKQVEEILFKAYGTTLPFINFDYTPIGSGCLACVYKANLPIETLKSMYKQEKQKMKFLDGYTIYKKSKLATFVEQDQHLPIAIKIQRPKLKESIDNDFKLLIFLVQTYIKLQHYKNIFLLMLQCIKQWCIDLFISENNKSKHKSWNVEKQILDKQLFEINFLVCCRLDQWYRDFLIQIDSQLELDNITDFTKSYYELQEKIEIPFPFDNISKTNHGIIAMEFLDGIPLCKLMTDNVVIDNKKEVQKKMYDYLIELSIYSVFLKDMYNGDLHSGNLLCMPQSSKLAVVDYGLVHKKSVAFIKKSKYVFNALFNEDWIAATVGIFDILISDRDRERKFTTVEIFQMFLQLYNIVVLYGYYKKLSTGQVLQACFKILDQHQIRSNMELAALDVSALTLESVLQSLRPHSSLSDEIFDNIVSKNIKDDYKENHDTKKNNENKVIDKDILNDEEIKQLEDWKIQDLSKDKCGIIYELEHYIVPPKKFHLELSQPTYKISTPPPKPWENKTLQTLYKKAIIFNNNLKKQ